MEIYFSQLNILYMERGALVAYYALVFAVGVALYVLRSLGLYKLAKNAGLENTWPVWIPCIWIYTGLMLVGEYRFFGKQFKKWALAITIVFGVFALLSAVDFCLTYLPVIGYYLQGGEKIATSTSTSYVPSGEYYHWLGTGVFLGKNFVSPYANETSVELVLDIIGIFTYFYDLVEIVVLVSFYIAIFRKYWPVHYILAAVLSFFGLFPIFIFAIRNKRPVVFSDYVRNRYGYRNPYGPNRYDNPYGNGYGQNVHRPNQDQADAPFSEFNAKDDEPFSEFNTKDDDK